MATLQEVKDYVEAVRAGTESDFMGKINVMVADYEQKIENLRSQVNGNLMALKDATEMKFIKEKRDHKPAGLTQRKTFGSFPKYGGNPNEYDDWKFQLKSFLSEDDCYAELLIELELLLEVPTVGKMSEIFDKLNAKYIDLDMEVMNKQMYQLLSLNLKDKALSIAKNLFDKPAINGFASWWKLGYENNAMTS